MIILRKKSDKFQNSDRHFFSNQFYEFEIKNLMINSTLDLIFKNLIFYFNFFSVKPLNLI